ncbi:MAG TPA: histidinol dehydrogenase [Candidatus Nanoarchaeia archaeon]|nr:histidinol dehydrogenase [Candidatus Nanoarchaeia archaeon]
MRIVQSRRLSPGFFDRGEGMDIPIVDKILRDVRKNGDAAVKSYTLRFDGAAPKRVEISKKDIKKAYRAVDKKVITAIKAAARNITAFSKAQFSQFRGFEMKVHGAIVGQKILPLQSVGCYVPGGRYPLPSSALMSIIPAKVAGVQSVIVCSPKIAPATIVAADIAGADRIFSVGGAQAIGALAYGTKTIPSVDKIVGPGNKYVAYAKRQVYGEVGIDFIAGPSEVMVIADNRGDAKFIAADLLAQAEHDPHARSDLLTTSAQLAKEVNEQIRIQLPGLATRETAQTALKNGTIVLVRSMEEAAEIANKRAPEHLELQVQYPEKLISQLKNFGSLFIGKSTPEVFGDYCSGTNHILPTNGAARYTGGLSVRDFVKIVTYQKIKGTPPKSMIEVASTLAQVEGLDAHRKAALIRSKDGKPKKGISR